MKHSKLLLLPLLFMVSSCVSISQSPSGPIFNPDNGQFGDDPKITYYEDNSLGDTIPEIPADAKKLDFKNNAEHVQLYKGEDNILKDFPEQTSLVKSYEYNRIGKGIYGLSLVYDAKNRDNLLTVNLQDGITAQYISINCSPAYYNTFNEAGQGANKYEYTCNDAAIQPVREGDNEFKYLKLKAEKLPDESDPEGLKYLPKVYDVTFDLGEAKSSFALRCYSWSVVINSITFF